MVGSPRMMRWLIRARIRGMASRVVMYEYTNESLEAVIAGLAVQPNDVVLATTGSGDQSFALVEKTRKVISIDEMPAQLEYVKRRAELLSEGKYEEFLAVSKEKGPERALGRRNRYFSEDGRLDRIRSRLDYLQFVHGDMLNPPSDILKEVSKIYLSNVTTDTYRSVGDYVGLLERLANSLPTNGLIYISDYHAIREAAEQEGFSLTPPATLRVSRTLTSQARCLEDKSWWVPIVYRKV